MAKTFRQQSEMIDLLDSFMVIVISKVIFANCKCYNPSIAIGFNLHINNQEYRRKDDHYRLFKYQSF